jgi:hypothetical protein
VSVLADLLKGPRNDAWDLARLMSAGSFLSYTGAFLAALVEGHVPDWAALGVGYAAVLAGSGALIGAKDMAGVKANAPVPVQPPEGA